MPTKRSGPLVGKCPKCGNNIVLKKSFYGCSNYPECKFTLAEHFRKKKLTKTNVKELLEGKETLVKGIKNKEKKPYNAVVKMQSQFRITQQTVTNQRLQLMIQVSYQMVHKKVQQM
ncbi:topoisomerase DNA-binding C4 zinc finger domain-containing protein [Staphylococcus pseudintermedius]|uniref:topoisomerase DNA-binding C4 zinc finger domain-containing protein n=1 Tax=Staphylococcus pseudintermedius TaxID=283734 RepID=UPI004044CD38